MPDPGLITTAQAAEILGVSVATLTRWARSGRVPPAHRLPGVTGALLFDAAQIREITDKGETP